MNINRSGYYKWLSRRFNPSNREINRRDACRLFEDYHDKYPSHGYRWLNAKIRLDLGIIYSNNYAHKICKFLGIKSLSKHVKRYGKKGNREMKNFPNYILAELNPLRPFQLVVSDMTAFGRITIIMNSLYLWIYLIMKLLLIPYQIKKVTQTLIILVWLALSLKKKRIIKILK